MSDQPLNDRRVDEELRAAIDAVGAKDPVVYKALVLMQDRTRRYAMSNRSRLNQHGRLMISLAVFIAIILAVFGTWNGTLSSRTNDLSHKNKDAIEAITASRRSGLKISCGFDSAVIEAGRVIITSGTGDGLPPSLRRFLMKHGLPSVSMQEEAAQQAAIQYAKSIAGQIVKVAGAKGSGIINLDGSVNCKKFERAVLGPG